MCQSLSNICIFDTRIDCFFRTWLRPEPDVRMEYICKSRACDDRDGSKHKVKSSLRPDIELPVPSCGGSWTLWPASAAQTGRAGSFLLTRCRQTSGYSHCRLLPGHDQPAGRLLPDGGEGDLRDHGQHQGQDGGQLPEQRLLPRQVVNGL